MAITIERKGNRIHAAIPYDNGAGPAEAKCVPGASWSKAAKRWTYPLDLQICRALRGQFGERLVIGPELWAWSVGEVAKERAQVELRAATDAALSVVPTASPVLAAAMANRPYQNVGAKFIADGRSVLVADEPGMGKTLESLAAVVENGARNVIIFAKKKAASTVWAPEIKRWLGDLATVWVATGDMPKAAREAQILDFATADEVEGIKFLICNIEMVRWTGTKRDVQGERDPQPTYPMLFAPLWDAIIVDESHKALIGRHTMSDSVTQTRYGMMKLRLAENGLKVALSGTPFRGKLEKLWGTLNWLQPQVHTGFTRFVEMFFEFSDNRWGGREIGELRADKVEAFDAMLAPIMIRRTKAEVATELPRKQYGGSPLDPEDPASTVGIWGEMSRGQRAAYLNIKNDGVIKFEDGQIKNVNGILAELTRRKQFAVCEWKMVDGKVVPKKGTSWKYDWIMEKLEEVEGKLVVFSQFTAVLNAFFEWATGDKVEALLLTGETKAKDVEEAVRRFNDPEDTARIIFVNTYAGGESINLDRCADTAVFVDETFIPDDQEQAEDRIHRMSRIHQVVVYYLRSLDSVEESICRITGAREALVKARLDGSRGKIFARLIKEE